MSKGLKALERYTKKSEKFIDAYEWNRELPTKTFVQLGINKLGQHEDIEDELGIDLVTLINILRTGGHIWVKNCKGINEWHVESLKQRGLDKQWYLTYSNNVRVKLKDYGKTWALTKEELE